MFLLKNKPFNVRDYMMKIILQHKLKNHIIRIKYRYNVTFNIKSFIYMGICVFCRTFYIDL